MLSIFGVMIAQLRLKNMFDGGWNTYFLLPIIGPLVGAIAAGWLYMFFAGYQIPDSMRKNRKSSTENAQSFEKRELVKENDMA